MNDEVTPDADAHAPSDGRYARLDLDESTVVVYDRNRTDAWIQSDRTVSTEEAAETDADRERRLAARHAERPGAGSDAA
ncbi:hypothetical protein [Halorussus salinus]|uniref:hypothetical protein n=1 Tax=Halorussus salinus TaxID=1364935 RepID=UPI001091CB5C|nr:hypothetical protein [Halorussus salinus]